MKNFGLSLKKTFVILILSSIFSTTLLYDNVSASIVGNYYLQNFDGYVNGQTNFSWYDEGNKWGSYYSSKSSHASISGNKIFFSEQTTSASTISYFNITQSTTYMNFSFINQLSSTDTTYLIQIYNSFNIRLFCVYLRNYFSGSAIHYYHLYGKTNATNLYGSDSLNYWNTSGLFEFRFVLSNTSINMKKTGISDGNFNIWYNVGIDFNSELHFKMTGVTTGASKFNFIDNIYFLSGLENPWEITSDYSIGSVLQIPNNYSVSLTTGSMYALVEDKILSPFSLKINQFALAVTTSTEITKLNILLHINGFDFGYIDNNYYYEGSIGDIPRYICVWTNLNYTFLSNLIEIEIEISAITQPAYFEFMVYNGDIDNDGTIEFKYSTGTTESVLPYFNGIYDGKWTSSISEIMFKLWGDFTNESVDCGIDFSYYSNRGGLVISSKQQLQHFVEIPYQVKSTMVLRGLELLIGSETYDAPGGSLGYHLKVNGESIGGEDCIVKINNDWYKVMWSFNKTLFNEYALFEISSPTNLVVSLLESSIDGDGTLYMLYHDDIYLFDGVANGVQLKVSNTPFDFAYKFYYTGLSFNNATSPYSDMITLSTQNSYYTYNNIIASYFIGDITVQSHIELWHNGSQVINDIYPYPYDVPIGIFRGDINYVPIHSGNYQFKLVRSSITIKSVNFTIIDPPNIDYILTSYPNPYTINTEFNIFYRYYSADGKPGMIILNDGQNVNTPIETWNINSNTSSNLSYIGIMNYYIMLYKETSNTSYYQLKTVYQEVIKFFKTNIIQVQYPSYGLIEGESFKQHITGYNAVSGFNVYVKLNNGNIHDSTHESMINFLTYDISTSGNYIVTLEQETTNGSIILAQTNFTVSVTPTGQTEENAADLLFGPYTYVFAIGVIAMFLFLPMTVASKLGIELPMIANIGSAALGLAFCTLTTPPLLPLYVIFIAVVAMVVSGIVIIFTR